MYELCCLECPFQGKSELILYQNIVKGDFSPIPPEIYSENLRKVIHSMLQKIQESAKKLGLFQYFPAGLSLSSTQRNTVVHVLSFPDGGATPIPITARAMSAPEHTGTRTMLEPEHHHKAFNIYEALPEYEILEEVGEGRVYVVKSRADKSVIVAKVISHMGERRPKAELTLPLLEMEMQTCPYLVQCFSVKELILGRTCIFMEYCAGGNLAKRIAERRETAKPFSKEEILKVIVQVGSGLIFLHKKEKPIMHRDVKPENILLTGEGNFKLGDFGLATIMKSSKSRRQSIVGTDGYIAPEVLQDGDEGYSTLADVFSFGIVLYEMIMLRNPFWEEKEDGTTKFAVQRARKAAMPALQAPNLNPDLLALVNGFLTPDINKRLTIDKALETSIVIDFLRRCPDVMMK